MTSGSDHFPMGQTGDLPAAGVQQLLPLGPAYANSQRWLDGRDSFRPSRERIRPEEFAVEPLDRMSAKRFVERHHYSHTFVYELKNGSFGLWHKKGLNPARLVGVASFSTPSNPGSIMRWAGLDDFRTGAELGRFVLLDEVAGNGESYFLARALRGLKQEHPELRVILSYSDPVPRRNLDTGALTFCGHLGCIYKATNAFYAGRASPKTLLLGRAGEAIPNRILTKLRNGEDGAEYAQDRLERVSGIRRHASESAPEFIERALNAPAIRRTRHPGNHLYLFPLAENRRDKAAILKFPAIRQLIERALPYPKALDRAA